MSDENSTSDADPAASDEHPPVDLIYESNPKHSEPWQVGKKGSLCDAEIRPLALELLQGSVLWEDKRYAVHEGRAYCAQQHLPDRWHGFPVGWVEVPPKLVRDWIKEGRLRNHDRKKYWESH